MTKRQDPEIIAMRACWKAIRGFTPDARYRMVAWLSGHINDEPFIPEGGGT